ncbi:C2 domain-containing protein 2 [Ambystoma mexicanum]|uniref:C2 domain-containing protein 2 n=1 Tax=Ambystoma mexicanum TaxID=8296 RepID=UPI0037E7F9DD
MSWLGDVQWFVLVTLFVAALVTLSLYLVQYALGILWRPRGTTPAPDLLHETDSLLTWVLSLNSWRSQWLTAWISALNREAKNWGSSLKVTFEEDGINDPLDLRVKQTVSVVRSAQEKVICCNVMGESIQFSVLAAPLSNAALGGTPYRVQVSPLHLQLELHMKEEGGEIQVTWSLIHFQDANLHIHSKAAQEMHVAEAVSQTLRSLLLTLLNSVHPSVVLSTKPTDVKDCQNVQSIGNSYLAPCPPKPPRAHELKLQVKHIRATLLTGQNAAGSVSTVCVAQLNNPLQKFSTPVAQNTTNLSWEEEFTFDLNAKSKELHLQILEAGKSSESSFNAWVAVPLDLFRKQPSGEQSFALSSRPSSNSPVSGSVTAEFSYVEPTELKSWQVAAPPAATKVEKDRTVMPCGTVVTTVTAVKTKPRPEGKPPGMTSESPARTPPKVKVIEKDLFVRAIPTQGAPVSKALSSSDTELLMLNGTDPVAEAAIRQLRESAKQSLKSPRKKSTIIISGISKMALSQDHEAALMFDYAAAMDGTVNSDDCYTEESTTTTTTTTNALVSEQLTLSSLQTLPVQDLDEDTLQDAWGFSAGHSNSPSGDWNLNGPVEKDCEQISISSTSVSELGNVKKSKGGFLRKGAKLFFRRRHHQKEPGMSQSHNDLVYLEQPTPEETRKKGTTLTRMFNKKLHPKSKNKNKLSIPSTEMPHT